MGTRGQYGNYLHAGDVVLANPKFSKSELDSFFANRVWIEISRRTGLGVAAADDGIETGEPFKHGIAVGERRAYRTIQNMETIMRTEAEGTAYGRLAKAFSAKTP